MKNCTSVCDQKFRGPVYDLLWADVRPHFQKKSGASEHGAAIIPSLPVRILTTPTSNQSPFPRGPFVFRRNLVRMRFPDCQVEQFRLPDCQVEQFGPPNWPFQTWAVSKIRPDRRGRDWTKPSGINNQCTSNSPASWDHIKNNSFEKEGTGTTSRITGPPRNNHNQNNETYNPIHTLFYSSLIFSCPPLFYALLFSTFLYPKLKYDASTTMCGKTLWDAKCIEGGAFQRDVRNTCDVSCKFRSKP